MLRNLSRREFLKASSVATAVAGGAGLLLDPRRSSAQTVGGETCPVHGQHAPGERCPLDRSHGHGDHAHLMGTVGEVDHARNGFDPSKLIYDWDWGTESRLASGQVLREYRFIAQDREIEVAPGVFFPAWTYNGRVPGPTIRCREGERIRIEFLNAGSHPHTIHFHGIHSATMDGVPGIGAGMIQPGQRTVYEFDALPFGCHLYHCHSVPLKRHIHKGLYGAFIVEPDPQRHPGQAEAARLRGQEAARQAGIHEMVMVMNGFDTNFDGENEIYAVNSVAFHYQNHPIRVGTEERVRLYLINITEFDPINSLHLHANFFDYYDHGTTLEPTLRTVDTIMQCQAQRGILEFSFAGFEPGLYMIHAHQSEFAELGWMGFFEAVEGRVLA